LKTTKSSCHSSDHRGRFSQEKFSISQWQKVGNLKEMIVLGISSRGNSLCVIIPKDLADVQGVISGDRVRVWFLDHYRKKREDE
jgi:hypothetical protein